MREAVKVEQRQQQPLEPVSYTHLDVYKRQAFDMPGIRDIHDPSITEFIGSPGIQGSRHTGGVSALRDIGISENFWHAGISELMRHFGVSACRQPGI